MGVTRVTLLLARLPPMVHNVFNAWPAIFLRRLTRRLVGVLNRLAHITTSVRLNTILRPTPRFNTLFSSPILRMGLL